MRIGILGSGLMGGKLGTIFARAGHDVTFSYAHSKEKLEKLARDTRKNARAGTPREAAEDADALLLAVHWSRIDDVLKQAGDVAGKIIITCSLPMNAKDTELVIAHTSSGAEKLAHGSLERHRRIVVGHRGRHEDVGSAGPGAAVLRDREVHLERNRALGIARHGGQRRPALRREEALERELVFAERRPIELGLDVRPERGVAECQRQRSRQLLGRRRRPFGRRNDRRAFVGRRTGGILGASERRQDDERRSP